MLDSYLLANHHMKRGVMQLPSSEAKEALSLITSSQENTPLHQKLLAVQEGEGLVGLQLDEEEVEILLDNVGIPEEGESEVRKSLRDNLRNFLLKLRQ